MAEIPLTPEQEEEQTKQFLRTNGPKPGIFAPDQAVVSLLASRSDLGDLERNFYLTQSTQGKQNDYIINQIHGLKLVSATIHRRLEEGEKRFTNIESCLAVFTELRNNYLNKKKMRWKVILGALTLFILPFLSIFMSEVCKHFLKWP
jgi:hypothetical protein